MRQAKYVSTLLLALCVVFFLLPGTARAAEIASGYCGAEGDGTGVQWTLDDTGTLTISGEGAMADYSRSATARMPWYDNRSRILEVIIQDGVTSIGAYAFNSCTGLARVTIPGSVTSIGTDAFCWCGLTGVDIPANVSHIGARAFGHCSDLEEINVAPGNAYYTSVGGILFSKDETLLHTYPSGKSGTSYSVPEGVTSIQECAFSGCRYLTGVDIPASVTSIGSRAFYGCSALTSINLASGNTSYVIDDNVLFSADRTLLHTYLDKSVTSYTIPEGVTTIGDGAFRDCSALVEVIIPEGVTTIGYQAFYDSLLTVVDLPGSVASIGQEAFYRTIPGVEVEVYFGGNEEAWMALVNNLPDGNNALLTTTNIHYTYTVTFDPNGGALTDGVDTALTDNRNDSKLSSLPAAPVRDASYTGACEKTSGASGISRLIWSITVTDYAFDGWYTQGGTEVLAGTPFTSDTTVRAQWVADIHGLFVTFDANGGYLDESAADVSKIPNWRTVLPAPVRSGFSFSGWYTAATGGEPVTPEDVFNSESIELYAHWTETPVSSSLYISSIHMEGGAAVVSYTVTYTREGMVIDRISKTVRVPIS